MRRELPELVIEICSSGGHRLSPAWMQLGTMASFSDAHESIEIPIIAANTARMIPMRHNQIWAVLHPDDDDRRLGYSLAAGMLGRLCLSGEVAGSMPANSGSWTMRSRSTARPSRRSGAARSNSGAI